MILNDEYVRISDLFEDAAKRASQLALLASVLHGAIVSPDSSPAALSNTAWLLTELLQEHCGTITELQDAHRRDFFRDKANDLRTSDSRSSMGRLSFRAGRW